MFLLSLLPWQGVGRSNFDWGMQKLINVDSNNDIKKKKLLYIYIVEGCNAGALHPSTVNL